MGSFYGGGCSGGGGSSNYADLKNAPITVLNGSSESSFINLAGLDPGNYNVKGYYKKDIQRDTQYALEAFDIVVSTDESSNKKIVRYFTVEEEQLYLNMIIYSGGLVEKESKRPFGSSGQDTGSIYWEEMF